MLAPAPVVSLLLHLGSCAGLRQLMILRVLEVHRRARDGGVRLLDAEVRKLHGLLMPERVVHIDSVWRFQIIIKSERFISRPQY